MWMFYSAESWPIAEDLNSAVERLRSKFHDLSFEACHAQNYDLDYCFDEEAVAWLKDLEARYDEAHEVCDLFLSGEISLECLLFEFLKLDFQQFINELEEFLPDDLKNKFVQIDEEEEEEEGGSQSD